MERQQLIKTLDQLHADLSQTEHVDPETLARLLAITSDIQRILSERPETSMEEVSPVSSSLKDVLLKFEADHPELATSVGKVADALAAMGF
ncbi:MAG: DUF4404 family protein [Planctomycetes bacterium]|jgi:hypothetical protein|nr:DUF4404 family protein [Planctomycetota bacterium]